MKAVVVRGVNEVTVETVDDARIEAPTDILMRVTSAAVCGTDLHVYEGRMGDVTGMVIGHEPLGVVEEVGPAVASIRKGDRDLIIAGRAKPSVIVSHRLPLADAPDAFRRFDRREDGYIKVILDPVQS